MRSFTHLFIVGLMAISICEQAFGKTLRATEMDTAARSAFSSAGAQAAIIEFRQGDQLPITLSAEGDLLETTQTSTGIIGVKRNFWLKLEKNEIAISFDGATFKPLNEAVAGSIQAGAGGDSTDGVANAINIALKAYLK